MSASIAPTALRFHMLEPRQQVIVYDLDGTLVAGDIGKAFLNHLLRTCWWRQVLAALVAPFLLPMLHVQGLRRPAISSFLWLGSVGRAARIADLARVFAADYPLQILPTATTSLRADLMGPHTIVVATGAWEELSAVLLDRMGLPRAPALVASRTRHFAGGLVVGRQCNGFEKIAVLRAEGFAPPYDRAITDAWLDWPLLAEARTPILVTESPELAARMRRHLGPGLEVLAP